MSAPFGLRFMLTFILIYAFARTYPLIRFESDLFWDHIGWGAATLLMTTLSLSVYFGVKKFVLPAIFCIFIVLLCELLSLLGFIHISGREGTPLELSAMYISGLFLSIVGIAHSSRRFFPNE